MHIQFYIPTIALRLLKWSLLPAFAIALMLVWGNGGGEAVIAQEDAGRRGANGEGEAATHIGSNPNLNIGIAQVPDECDTLDSFDDLKCRIEPGGSFTLQVFVDSFAGLPNPWYTGVSVGLSFSPGLTLKDRPGDGEFVWPDCSFASNEQTSPVGLYGFFCSSQGVESTHIGSVLELDFNCPAEKSKETITLHHGRDSQVMFKPTSGAPVFVVQHMQDTSLQSLPSAEDDVRHEDGPAETLIINCDNYYPWDVHGPGQSADLDGIVDLPNDILGVIQHFCPLPTDPCAKQ